MHIQNLVSIESDDSKLNFGRCMICFVSICLQYRHLFIVFDFLGVYILLSAAQMNHNFFDMTSLAQDCCKHIACEISTKRLCAKKCYYWTFATLNFILAHWRHIFNRCKHFIFEMSTTDMRWFYIAIHRLIL